ncbi:hypothetical protein AURDEDRAFT_159244 [Auricularia subglabra TFB-10046 SS5]|nr:hypothetical protein AURDEDRAFT_159244 [Auricularia subglabra TFB-10046 SS5]
MPDGGTWVEWDDVVADFDIAHDDSLPHTGVPRAKRVSSSYSICRLVLGSTPKHTTKQNPTSDAERLLVGAEIATGVLRAFVKPKRRHTRSASRRGPVGESAVIGPEREEAVASSMRAQAGQDAEVSAELKKRASHLVVSARERPRRWREHRGKNVRDSALKNDREKRQTFLPDSLEFRELSEIRTNMTAENPFTGMKSLSKDVFQRMLEDARVEPRAPET